MAGTEGFYIKGKERDALSLKISRIDFRTIRVTIHDPFLWKVFYPDTDYHEGGCQAANSLLYISPEYRVYPCPAMSIELGDLHETTLRKIVLSATKKELRRSLLNPPTECVACNHGNTCLGGCRGRAFASANSLSRSDPACK
jgi:GeoRSP system SPASM domain protein